MTTNDGYLKCYDEKELVFDEMRYNKLFIKLFT
jgi:hypothetical protein